MALVTKRITREIQKLEKDSLPYGIRVIPGKENIMEWEAYITGGKDTPHDNLEYKLLVTINSDYPRKPPSIKFISKIFHPNVYRDGKICIDILQNQWAPTLRIVSALVSIQSMLDDPNPNSPANVDAAVAYRKGDNSYKNKIIEVYNSNKVNL